MTNTLNDLPDPLADVGEDWPPIPIQNASVTFTVQVPDVSSLPEVIDLAMVTVGRWGLEPLDIYIEDNDVEGRDFVVRQGALYSLASIREAQAQVEPRHRDDRPDPDA